MGTWWRIQARSRTNASTLTVTKVTATRGLSDVTWKTTTSTAPMPRRRPLVECPSAPAIVCSSLTEPSCRIFPEEAWNRPRQLELISRQQLRRPHGLLATTLWSKCSHECQICILWSSKALHRKLGVMEGSRRYWGRPCQRVCLLRRGPNRTEAKN